MSEMMILTHYRPQPVAYEEYDCTDYNNITSEGSGSNNRNNNITIKTQFVAVSTDDQANAGGTTAASEGQQQRAEQQRQLYPVTELHQEAARASTFNNVSWTVPFLDIAKLAQIGFYYMGRTDLVKCYFCKVEIGKWEPDDDCFTEHYRWSSNCPLLRRHHTNNVPLDAEALDQILPPVTYDTCGTNGGGMVVRRPNAYAEGSVGPNFDNQQPGSSLLSVGGNGVVEGHHMRQVEPETATEETARPVMWAPEPSAMTWPYDRSLQMESSPSFYNMYTTPDLEIEANRLKTFKDWPINLKMKPVELSDAGFFYTGVGDRVQCFSCGGRLKNWEADEEGWEQHALWFGDCNYVKLIKGQKYIDAVAEKHRLKRQQQQLLEGQVEEMPSTSAGEGVCHSVNSNGTTRMTAENAATKSESTVCKICYESEYNTAFIPCGHVVACAKCASSVTKCPLCREPFDNVIRIFFS